MSSLPRNGCPAMSVLDAAARAEVVEPDVQRHLDDCVECRVVLANMRSNDAFLAHHRRALAAQAAGPGAIPGCQLLGEIHRGGQGVVYKGIQTATRRTVAVKLLRAGALAGREEQSRFEREARILGQLHHPNIVTVHDSGIAAGLHYLVLDYVEGRTLDRYIAGGVPKVRAALALFVKICEAVHAAHLRGIIHRDLKPSNVMIDEAGEPHVLDFGLAKATVDATDMTRMTLTGQFFGTPAWASPEQAGGDMTQVDLRTDVYALGVLLYYLLTGVHPYDVNGTLHSVLENVRHAPPTSPRRHRSLIDGEVETIVLKSLQKDRERRYQTAGELARDIRRYLAGQAIEARRDSTWYVLSKVLRRHRLRVSAVALALLVLPAFSIWMTVLYRRAREAERAIGAKSAELAQELSRSNIERGRMAAAAGNAALAERIMWTEFLTHAGGSTMAREAHAGLREIYARHPCLGMLLPPAATGPWGSMFRLMPDSQKLIAVHSQGPIYQWDLRHFRVNAERRISDWSQRRSRLSPDGKWLSHRDPTRLDWVDTETGAALGGITVPNDEILEWSFSPDRARLVVGMRSGCVRLYDTSNGALITELPTHPGPITSVCFAPNGDWLVSASGGGRLELHDLRDGASVSWNGPEHLSSEISFDVVVFSRDSRRLAGNAGKEIVILGTPELTLLGHWPSESDMQWAIDFSPDGTHLATAGSGSTVQIWDISNAASPRPVRTFVGDGPVATGSLQYSRDGQRLVAMPRNGTVRIWEVAPSESASIDTRFDPQHVTFDAKRGQWVCCGPREVRCYDKHTGELRANPQEQSVGQISCAALARDPRFVSTRSFGGSMYLIDPVEDAPGEQPAADSDAQSEGRTIPRDPQSALGHAAVSPNGRRLATCNARGEILLFDSANGGMTLMARMAVGRGDEVAALAFSPDSRLLASTGHNGSIEFRTAEDGTFERRIEAAHRSTGCTLTFSPDGRVLASGGDDATIRVWNVETGALVRSLVGHQQTVLSLCFSPDGALLSSGARAASGDREAAAVIIWDMASGRILRRLYGHEHTVLSVAFSADGRRIASLGLDGTLLIHRSGVLRPPHRRKLRRSIAAIPGCKRDARARVGAPLVGRSTAQTSR